MIRIKMILLVQFLMIGSFAAAGDDYSVFRNRYTAQGFEDPQVAFSHALKRSPGEWKQDNALATRIHSDLIREYGAEVNNPTLEKEVMRILRRLVAVSHNPDLQVKLFLLDNREVNAFSTGADRIYVLTGFLRQFPDEETRAFVLAHELAHAMSRHSWRGVKMAQRLQQMMAKGRVSDTEARLQAMLFKRILETEADVLGAYYVSRAGFRVSGHTRFLEWSGKMELERYAEIDKFRQKLHKAADEVRKHRGNYDLLDRQYRMDRSPKTYDALILSYEKLKQVEATYNELKKTWDQFSKQKGVVLYGTESDHPGSETRIKVITALRNLLSHRGAEKDLEISLYVFTVLFPRGYFLVPPGKPVPFE